MVLVTDMPRYHACSSDKVGRVSDGISGNKLLDDMLWCPAEEGVLDSGDAGFRRHISVICERKAWPRVFARKGSWPRK